MKIKLEYQCDPEEADLVAWTTMHTLDQLGLKYEEPQRTNQTDVSGGNVLDSTLVTVYVLLDIKDAIEILHKKEVVVKSDSM